MRCERRAQRVIAPAKVLHAILTRGANAAGLARTKGLPALKRRRQLFVDLRGARSVWRYDRIDGMVLAITAVGVLVAGIEAGLAIGIIGQLTCGIFSLVATLMIFSTYHETMWDKWAGTLVVDDREGRTLA